MNKKLMTFGLIAMFAVTLVSAAYLVQSFIITTDVYEPFEIRYAILGNAGNWDSSGSDDCNNIVESEWQLGSNVDVGGLYAGEGRMVCAEITNLGEGDVSYTISAEVISGLGNMADCEYACANPTVTGTALGSVVTKDGVAVTVAGDATPVDDCQVTLSVTRG